MSTIEDSGGVAAGETTDAGRIEDTEFTASEAWTLYGSWAVTVINLTIFFIIWELFVWSGAINPLFLPRASSMFSALWEGFTTRPHRVR